MPLTHLTLDELQQHAAAKPDDPELVAEVMARFTAGGLVAVEEAESDIDERYAGGYEDGYEDGYKNGYDIGYLEGYQEGSNRASESIA